MAGLQELNSFIGKFVSLWKGGFEASLNIQSKAGKATMNLQVELEEALPVKKVSPSQFRRRERRAEARRLADEAAEEDEVEETTVSATSATVVSTAAEKAIAEKVKAVEAIGERARSKETTAEKEAVSSDEPNTPAVEVERVLEETVEKDKVPKIDDEFCSNEVYSQEKTVKPSPRSSSVAPPSTYRKPVFDYYTLDYDDSD